jgi:hypothetical protein
VHLLATAGLRLLSDKDAADILMECAAVLASSQFLFQVIALQQPIPPLESSATVVHMRQ